MNTLLGLFLGCRSRLWAAALGACFINLLPALAQPPASTSLPAPVVQSLDDCIVVWDSPSADSFGSMPLGNGDVGANVWVEANGDVLFYVSFESHLGLPVERGRF